MLEEEKNFDASNFVDEVLKSEPDFTLSDNFADTVAEKVNRRFAWNQYLKEFFLYLGLFLAILFGVAAFSLFWFKADWKLWLDFVQTNIPLVAGVGIILLFVLFTDKVLLRYFLFKSNPEIT